MHLYPGGTWWDRAARGHRFWQNYLCDLEWRVALDGRPNLLGARFAEGAMLSLIFAFVPFWWIVPRALADPGAARRSAWAAAVRLLGCASVAGMVAVALMPSEYFGALHGVAVVVAGVPGLTAAVLATLMLLRAEPRPRIAGWLGATMLVFALVDFALYVDTMWAGGPGPIALPAIQKVALMSLMAWMAAVALRARGRPQAPHARR